LPGCGAQAVSIDGRIVFETSQHACWHTSGNHLIRDGPRDDASGSDHRPGADTRPGKNCDATREPYAVADLDRRCLALGRLLLSVADHAVRTEADAPADGDSGLSVDCAAEVDVGAVAHINCAVGSRGQRDRLVSRVENHTRPHLDSTPVADFGHAAFRSGPTPDPVARLKCRASRGGIDCRPREEQNATGDPCAHPLPTAARQRTRQTRSRSSHVTSSISCGLSWSGGVGLQVPRQDQRRECRGGCRRRTLGSRSLDHQGQLVEVKKEVGRERLRLPFPDCALHLSDPEELGLRIDLPPTNPTDEPVLDRRHAAGWRRGDEAPDGQPPPARTTSRAVVKKILKCDRLRRADLHALAGLDDADELGGGHERVEGAGVEPGGAAVQRLDDEPALGEVVPVVRPRVRAVDGSGELPVPAYDMFSGTELLGRLALERRCSPACRPVATRSAWNRWAQRCR